MQCASIGGVIPNPIGNNTFPLYAAQDLVLKPDEYKIVHLGIQLRLPINTEARLYPVNGKDQAHFWLADDRLFPTLAGEATLALRNSGKEQRLAKGETLAYLKVLREVNCKLEIVDKCTPYSFQGRQA